MKTREICDLLGRAIGAIENAEDLTEEDKQFLVEDLEALVQNVQKPLASPVLVVMPFEDHLSSLYAIAPPGMAANDAANEAHDSVAAAYDDQSNDVIAEIYERLQARGFIIPLHIQTHVI